MENRQLQIYEAHMSRTVVQPFVAGHARRVLLVDSLFLLTKTKRSDEAECKPCSVTEKITATIAYQFVIEHSVRMRGASGVGAVQGVQIPGVHAQMRFSLDVLGIVDGEADFRAEKPRNGPALLSW